MVYPALRQLFQPCAIILNHENVTPPASRRTEDQVTAIRRP